MKLIFIFRKSHANCHGVYSYFGVMASVCSGRQADGEKMYLLLELFKRSDAKHMFTETRPYQITVPVHTNLLRYFIHENHNACLIHQCEFCHIDYKKSLKGFVPSSCVNCDIMVLWSYGYYSHLKRSKRNLLL